MDENILWTDFKKTKFLPVVCMSECLEVTNGSCALMVASV